MSKNANRLFNYLAIDGGHVSLGQRPLEFEPWYRLLVSDAFFSGIRSYGA